MNKNIGFQVLLPAVFLIVAVMMDTTGDLQMNRLVRLNVEKYGHLEEPLPQYYAIGRYVDYGFNAPAWLFSEKIPLTFFVTSFSYRGSTIMIDWKYLFFVALMWYLIGRQLDQRGRSREIGISPGLLGLRRMIRVLFVLYGIFLCYSAVQFYLVPWTRPHFFVVPMALWGAILMLSGIYPLARERSRTWSRIFGVSLGAAALSYLIAAIQLYGYRASFGLWSVALLLSWGLCFVIASGCLFRKAMASNVLLAGLQH